MTVKSPQVLLRTPPRHALPYGAAPGARDDAPAADRRVNGEAVSVPAPEDGEQGRASRSSAPSTQPGRAAAPEDKRWQLLVAQHILPGN